MPILDTRTPIDPIIATCSSGAGTSSDPVRAAYLHIPFCRRRCHYCDFATGLGTAELIERYVQVLCAEIRQWPVEQGSPTLGSIFLGGGTPSLLSGAQLGRILETLSTCIGIDSAAEISMEANPGTLESGQMVDYHAAGINRVSLGVQAFQPHLLEACGRSHGVTEVYDAVAAIRETGIHNFNLDLIFGLPHQSLDDWRESLDRVIELDPTHVSLYDLTIEPETQFGRLYRPGDTPLPTDEQTVEMYEMAIERLTGAGYHHYEISNFAQPGSQCRHNRVYWQNQNYYGFGMGAVAYIGHRRLHQPRKLHDYFQQVAQHRCPEADITSLLDQWQDTLMLGLRLREGLDLEVMGSRFPATWIEAALQVLEPYRAKGWVDWDPQRLWMIPPQGWLFSNSILADLFASAEQAADIDEPNRL